MTSQRITTGVIAAAIAGSLAGAGMVILVVGSKKGSGDQTIQAQSQQPSDRSPGTRPADVNPNAPRHQPDGGSSQTTSARPEVAKQPDSPEAPAPQPLPAAKRIEPGILLYEISLQHGSIGRQIWLYLPEQPDHATVPCVLVAPAGSNLLQGMDLGPADRAEHLPYVRAGMAVLAYSIDGNLDDDDKKNEQAIVAAARAFKHAEAGVANARQALKYALANVPSLDRDRIYTAGHSSAATLSLLVAEQVPTIKACIAYAPCTNVVERVPDQVVQALALKIPDFDEFITEFSPHTHTDQLRCPVFLFHAEDDSNVPIGQSAEFVAELKTTNPKVTFVRARSGNHYDSMIQEGIPRAIRWLRELPKESGR